jgi:REP element-mobilizing transposase RayT
MSLPKLDKNGQHRGGPRKGAGRKPTGSRAGSPHQRRAEVDPRHPQHVVLRVVADVGWLRRPHAYRAIRAALVTALARHDDFRIVHFSLQGTHLHLLCEADHKQALAKGLQGFQIAAARYLNGEVSRRRDQRRRGRVFADRYHVESMSTVKQTRHTLSYVLNNWRRHKEDRGRVGLFDGRIDPFSSGVWFEGWKERTVAVAIPPDYDAPTVSRAQSWLLAEGWRRAAPISVYAVPGARR